MTGDELSKLQINYSLPEYSSTLNLRVYNGNENLIVSGDEIEITAPNYKFPQKYPLYFGYVRPKMYEDAYVSLAFTPDKGWKISNLKMVTEVCK